MAEHTKEPWEFDGPRHSIIVWSGPELRVCFMTSDGPCRENARRICAAVNSLSGIPTEALEAGIVGDMVEALRDTTASLTAAVSLLGRGRKTARLAAPSDKMFDLMLHDYEASLDRARSILSKLGGTNGK